MDINTFESAKVPSRRLFWPTNIQKEPRTIQNNFRITKTRTGCYSVFQVPNIVQMDINTFESAKVPSRRLFWPTNIQKDPRTIQNNCRITNTRTRCYSVFQVPNIVRVDINTFESDKVPSRRLFWPANHPEYAQTIFLKRFLPVRFGHF